MVIQIQPDTYVPGQQLIPRQAIDDLAQQIAARFDPERIYLFGSYAYGTPNPDSDVDIMVIMQTDDMEMQANRVRRELNFAYPLDLLVRTPLYFAERLALGDFFIQQVMEQGQVLYDSKRHTLPDLIAHPPVTGPVYELVGGVYLNKLTSEWVNNAEIDYKGAGMMLQSGDSDFYGLVCFLSQQCVEKYFKAYLQEHKIKFAKTHDLTTLLPLASAVDNSFSQLQWPISGLKGYAVDPRYPGASFTLAAAHTAYSSATDIRAFIRTKLGI